jgi:homospermidine synthase
LVKGNDESKENLDTKHPGNLGQHEKTKTKNKRKRKKSSKARIYF